MNHQLGFQYELPADMLLSAFEGLLQQFSRPAAHFEGILFHVGEQRFPALKDTGLIKTDNRQVLRNAGSRTVCTAPTAILPHGCWKPLPP